VLIPSTSGLCLAWQLDQVRIAPKQSHGHFTRSLSPSLKNICPLQRQIAPRLFLPRILLPNLLPLPIEEQSFGAGLRFLTGLASLAFPTAFWSLQVEAIWWPALLHTV